MESEALKGLKQRRKQPEATRRAILQAAGRGFAMRGYAATGIGEISEQSGLTRGALFHHFHDKQGLVLSWLEEELLPGLRSQCLEPVSTASGFRAWKEALSGIPRQLDQGHPASMLQVMATECANEPILGSAFAQVVERWIEDLSLTLEHGQDEGWIHRSIQPKAEAGLLVAQLCGAALLVRLAEDPAAVKSRCEQAVAAYLETMRGDS